MNAPQRRVVITGLGATTPLGTGLESLWQGLQAGKSGVRNLQAFDTHGQGTSIAAEVLDFDPKRYVKQRKSLKVMARDIQLAVAAAQMAVDDSGINLGQVDPTRIGVNFGAGYMTTDIDELGPPVVHSINGSRKFDLKKWGAEGMAQLFPLWMLKYLPNMPACHTSILFDAQGPNNSITAGEASAPLAIGEAYRVMMRGGADVFVAGATDCKIHPLSIVRLLMLGKLSRRNDDPSRACRPFDADRDGLVVGEGSGVFMLEELSAAQSRGARIYGEIIGFGSSCHPHNIADAVQRAVRRALADAGLSITELGHIIANGNGCVDDDRQEAIALANLLGPAADQVPVVGYKGYLGSLAAASGAVEIIASLLSHKHGQLLPTLNFEKPDADAPRLNIQRERTDFPNKPFLSYDFSHSGQCGALVIRPIA